MSARSVFFQLTSRMCPPAPSLYSQCFQALSCHLDIPYTGSIILFPSIPATVLTYSTLQRTSGDYPSLKYALQALWRHPTGSIICFSCPNVDPDFLPCPNAFSHLGGEDFDDCLVHCFAQGFKRNNDKGKFNSFNS
jgi:hypothetical protein